jgi:hypothetical protein
MIELAATTWALDKRDYLLKFIALKLFVMKKIILLIPAIIIYQVSSSQNVGIGVTNPTRAKLEVNGVAGNGNTSALFGGDGTGISLQRNWPTVGFNQYRDNTAGNGKYIGNGFAAIQYLDPNNGIMSLDFFTNGTANMLTPSGTRALSITPAANLLIGSSFSNASLSVSRNAGSSATATFFGTQYSSFINSGNSEATIIRAGKDGGDVLINDVPNGRILMGGNTTKVGINVGNPVTTLEFFGALTLRPVTVNVSPSNNIIDVGNRSHIIVNYNGGGGVLHVTLTNGLVQGQMLLLVGSIANNFQDVRFDEGPNTDFAGINGSGLENNDTLLLIWNGEKWTQVSFSKNT